TGDGDGLSIGGNHTIHLLRRNLDLNVMLFNNRIYGLTKGQYSPTSEVGKITKSTPMGSLDRPFNPLTVALGAGATFVSRTIDKELKHMQSMIKRSHAHKGTSFMEIYQNCNIFNDGAHSNYTDRELKNDTQLKLKHNEPMVFGVGGSKILKLEGSKFKVLSLDKGFSIDDAVVHNYNDRNLAFLLSEITMNKDLPTPFGIIYKEDKPTYDDMMKNQMDLAKEKSGNINLQKIVSGSNTWEVS
ncbi:MAG: 2-oxoacid:ferredoxin oxidoreductase subunit beta, partial [Candidatus Marinimicrobia bacterium]|nr:2-oxoacid:ferredoxin oxidoreductase subunit beta [Candidatus Neomarinimicrobiota bacterium]